MNNYNYKYVDDVDAIIKADDLNNFKKYVKDNNINVEKERFINWIGPEDTIHISLLTVAFDNNAVKIIDYLIKYLKDPIDNIGSSHDEQMIIYMMQRYEDTMNQMFLIKMNMSYEDILNWAIDEQMDNTIEYALYKVMKEGKQIPTKLPQKYKNIVANIANKEANKLNNNLPNNVIRYVIKPMVKYRKTRKARKTRKSRKSSRK